MIALFEAPIKRCAAQETLSSAALKQQLSFQKKQGRQPRCTCQKPGSAGLATKARMALGAAWFVMFSLAAFLASTRCAFAASGSTDVTIKGPGATESIPNTVRTLAQTGLSISPLVCTVLGICLCVIAAVYLIRLRKRR